jgi:hypothetical protein
MYTRHVLAVLSVCLFSTLSVAAISRDRYLVPRTEHGHPDFQGIWATAFLTSLERPQGVTNLVATPEEARTLVAVMRARMPAVIDPDVQLHDIQQLAMVKGEYRTSLIVDPEDGRLPFTEKGLELAARVEERFNKYDDPEQRPLAERCLENLAYAPIRSLRVVLPRQFIQTRDAVVISPEDSAGIRVIHLGGQAPPDAVRTIGGYSVGRWENDTLVVETTHLRADDPARNVAGRPLLLSRRTKVTERFKLVSPTELFYRYTVEDDELYTRPWSAEFSMTRFDQPIYEYACHEANYSLTNVLLGGRALQ